LQLRKYPDVDAIELIFEHKTRPLGPALSDRMALSTAHASHCMDSGERIA
jgi:hypothetical protein